MQLFIVYQSDHADHVRRIGDVLANDEAEALAAAVARYGGHKGVKLIVEPTEWESP